MFSNFTFQSGGTTCVGNVSNLTCDEFFVVFYHSKLCFKQLGLLALDCFGFTD